MSGKKLAKLSWAEVKDYLKKNNSVIIPVGSIEQHGEHLPLGTDTMISEEIALSVSAATGILVSPSVSCGWSPHHMVLPGTITIRPEVLIDYLYDIIFSLSEHGFENFLLINGHRIVNISWMQIAAERAKRQLGVRVAIADPAWLSKEFSTRQELESVGHADEIETSHMLFIKPDLVNLSKAKDNKPASIACDVPDPRWEGDVLCYVPKTVAEMKESALKGGGTTGTPSRSTAEVGSAYHEWVVEKLVKYLKQLQYF